MKYTMDKNRYAEWIDSSVGLKYIEMMVLHYAQGLGILDAELIEEFPILKINSQSEQDLSRKCRHIVLSQLWVFGAYELIRFINDINKKRNLLDASTKIKLKEVLMTFSEIRVPLAKFQKFGRDKTLYRGVADSYFDSIKGIAWKVYYDGKNKLEEKRFYRKDLGDSLLKLLKEISKDTSWQTKNPKDLNK